MDSRILLVFVIAAGIIVPGAANYYLATTGHETLGQIAWIGGYGLMVLIVWYGWIRPLDFGSGRDGTER